MNGRLATAREGTAVAPEDPLAGPLRITMVHAPGGGTLGLVHCPGRNQVDDSGRHWRRDLAADVAAIATWRPSAVLTLLEAHEFSRLGVPELAGALQAGGLEWHHLPIPDMGTPGPDFVRAWERAGHRVLGSLGRGERVLIHCAAGLGRTGMLAAKLLTALGMSPADAIRRVRAARPGAIETEAQAACVSNGPALGDAPNRDRVQRPAAAGGLHHTWFRTDGDEGRCR